jgi:hypothetical protein
MKFCEIRFVTVCFNLFAVYDDYKFVTRSELESLGLGHLIGTEFIRAYMHGFFLDIRLYHKVGIICFARLMELFIT